MFHIPKAKMSRFGLNTLRYDGANFWNKFYHALLYKEPNLTEAKQKTKALIQMHFLDTSKFSKVTSKLNKFSPHFRLFCWVFFQSYCSQNKII